MDLDTWYSKRFRLHVRLTRHATSRMRERSIDVDLIRELIEEGKIREKEEKDEKRFWIYHAFKNRDDNLICAAIVKEDLLIIKTIMHRWQLKETTI